MRILTIILGFLVSCGSPSQAPPEVVPPDAGAGIGVPDLAAPVDQGADEWSIDDYYQTSEVGPVPPYEQRPGDPFRGYDILVNQGYVSCGIPARIYDQFLGGNVPEGAKLPGRNAANADMPFNQTRFDRDGIELVSTNCLACHANVLPTGELYVGLGNEGDYTRNVASMAQLGRGLVNEEDEREVFEYDRFLERITVAQPHIRMHTVGVNPADNLAGILTAHRDPDTWEWLPEPWFEVPELEPVPLSVPPLWHTSKKNALYYTAVGHGDHARFMMAAALLCTDSLEEARAIDEMFVHVRAYLATIEPPPYPYAIDEVLAAQGEPLFEANCARCHGTYGAEPTYPNLVVALDEVGTDPLLADLGGLAGREPIAWLNRSFFGELSTIAPAPGYVAPPLDGIWATAPYFHNASVPTLRGVLNPELRPAFWRRDAQGFDRDRIGVAAVDLPGGKETGETDAERQQIYDTTLSGYSNVGHTFAAELREDEQTALLEYLKTL